MVLEKEHLCDIFRTMGRIPREQKYVYCFLSTFYDFSRYLKYRFLWFANSAGRPHNVRTCDCSPVAYIAANLRNDSPHF